MNNKVEAIKAILGRECERKEIDYFQLGRCQKRHEKHPDAPSTQCETCNLNRDLANEIAEIE